MTNSERLTSNNALIDSAIAKAEALPDAGSGGASVETCTVEIVFNSPAEDMYFDTISPELEYTRLSYTASELMSGVSFTVANNSFLVCSVGIGGEISGNIEAIDGALYLVRGSGTITTW